MASTPHIRQCARCGTSSPGKIKTCPSCGTTLVKQRFKMTPERIKRVHVLARQKGIDRILYKDNLNAVGVSSCKDMKEQHFYAFLARMNRLPNVPVKRRK